MNGSGSGGTCSYSTCYSIFILLFTVQVVHKLFAGGKVM